MISAIRVSCLALAASVALGTAARAAEHAPPSFAAKGELALCTDATFPPMEFFEKAGDQTAVGYDIDVAQALATHWNAKLRVVVADFAGLLPGLQAQRCDVVISGILVTEERTKTYDASPYLQTSLVIFTGKDSDLAISDPADLDGKVVAVQAGTAYVEKLQQVSDKLKADGHQGLTIQTYPKQTDVIQQVLVGRAVAAISQDTELAYREIQNPGQFKTIYTFPGEDKFGVYLRRNGDDKKSVDAALAALAADGTLKSITEKWRLSPDAIAAGK